MPPLGGDLGVMRDFVVLPDADEKVLDFAQKLLVAGVVLIVPNTRDTKNAKGPVAEVGRTRERGRRAVVRFLEVLAADERQELELVDGAQRRRGGQVHGDLAVRVQAADGRQHVQHEDAGAGADLFGLEVDAVGLV